MRRGDDDRLFRRGDGAVKALLYTRGTVDENIIELGRKIVEHEPHRLRGNVFFRRRMIAGQNVQVFESGVLYECLTGAATPLDDVADVVCNALFEARYDVDVVQSEIGVAQNDLLAAQGELRADVRRHRRLADAAFPRRENDFPCHTSLLFGQQYTFFWPSFLFE